MSYFVNKIVDSCNYVLTDLADPRTNNFFLMASPWPILGLISAYLYISLSFGPRYMKDRKPYNLKNVVLLYNFFEVVMSMYLFYEGVSYVSSEKFSYRCDPVDYSEDPRAMRMAHASWWYFFSKLTEFLDTIFFVLRKKNNQISFLHVYHHSMMAGTMWIGIKYIAGGHAVVMGTLNAFVHIIMYTYYLIAGLGPQYQKYVWWKKHVTVLQLAQFVLILIHNLNAFFSDCTYPKSANFVMILNSLLFIHLFGKFFYTSYVRGSSIENRAVQNATKDFTKGTYRNKTANGHNVYGKHKDS